MGQHKEKEQITKKITGDCCFRLGYEKVLCGKILYKLRPQEQY